MPNYTDDVCSDADRLAEKMAKAQDKLASAIAKANQNVAKAQAKLDSATDPKKIAKAQAQLDKAIQDASEDIAKAQAMFDDDVAKDTAKMVSEVQKTADKIVSEIQKSIDKNKPLSAAELADMATAYEKAIGLGIVPTAAAIDLFLGFQPPTLELVVLIETLQDGGYVLAITSDGQEADGDLTAASFTVDENTVAVTTITASNPQPNPVTYAIVGGADAGLFQIDAGTGALSFGTAPDAEAPGDTGGDNTYQVVVRASDAVSGQSDTQTLSITVANVNETPVAADGSETLLEDGVLSGSVTASDPDGDALTFALVSGPANGALALQADGTYTYTPDADFNGADSFDFKASDGSLESASRTVSLTVLAVNDAPVAIDGSETLSEDGFSTGAVNASDVDGDTLTYSLVTGPANGALTFQADGTYTYTPGADFNGADGFTFRANDGALTSATASVDLTVLPVNDAPVANAGSASGDEDTVIAGNATASDVDGDALVFSIASGPANGSVLMGSDGSYSYTPDADYNGTDSFDFTVSDGALSDIQTISLTVNPVPDGFTPNTAATQIAVNYVRALTYDPGHNGTSLQNFGGIAFDSVSGKVYESAGVHRYNENYVRVFDNAADFEAGTYSSTIGLGNQIDINYPSDITGTYFTAYDGQLIGRSSLYGSDYSPYSSKAWDVGFWNATTGAMNAEISVNPNADFTGLNYGGYNAMNVMGDGDSVYALSRYANSGTWQLAELDPTTNSVISTEDIGLGTVGYAFVVEDFMFIGNTYQSGNVTRVYDIENNTLSNVNLQFQVPANIYWSNTSYDSQTDTLYLVSSPNTSTLGEIYEVENVSDYLFV